jgi:hypothetical protein
MRTYFLFGKKESKQRKTVVEIGGSAMWALVAGGSLQREVWLGAGYAVRTFSI